MLTWENQLCGVIYNLNNVVEKIPYKDILKIFPDILILIISPFVTGWFHSCIIYWALQFPRSSLKIVHICTCIYSSKWYFPFKHTYRRNNGHVSYLIPFYNMTITYCCKFKYHTNRLSFSDINGRLCEQNSKRFMQNKMFGENVMYVL